MKKKLTGNIALYFLIFFVSVVSVHAQENEIRPYKLINADKLIINKIQGEYITNLFGNVHFFYGDTEFFSDKADIFELQKIVRMRGNVEVYDDTLSMKADNVDYFREKERLYLRGNVLATETHIDSTLRTFEAGEVEYFRNSREFFAKDNVQTYDERENIYGTCGELKYFLDDGYGYLIKEPVLSIADKDTLSISAEKIEYFKDYKKVAATFNVKTFSNDFVMTSDFLLYFADEEKAVYIGEPNFTSDLADATAIEFRIFFEDQKIKKAVLQDSCFVQFSDAKDKPKASWANGDLMEFIFEKGNISFCEAKGDVRSYFQQDEINQKDYSANNAKGEHLIIKMDNDNKIKMISMKDKVHGIYKFQHKNW
ncbi:MAG: LPS export ABC transporter periplasmic protein LptC [Candidatus Cloacimonetes bacterium]|jgi:lipopolysaccharide export system protein LptA|nr:LPS export ABC transporter periplasmic protein LptC [Candidatus Cloacimonadota bacterium]